MELDGKVVMVTGAGRGIGREIALRAAAAGADLVLAARSVDALEETADAASGVERLVVPTDVSDPGAVQACATAALDRFGRIDVLVNNSGIGGPSFPLWEVPLDEWKETLNVNVTGVFLCCRAVLPSMIERKSGAIVTIGSMTGKRELLNRSAYAASKAALIGLTRTLAHEVGPFGIRVNLISPGAVEGPRIEWVIQRQAEAQGISPEEARAQFTGLSPLDRLVAPGDIANSVVFLASDAAAGITGVDLNVTAGMVMY
jgi:NAD(P)-dependent dehydrogenase (short-subunit alcohol dehydrogenase family)